MCNCTCGSKKLVLSLCWVNWVHLEQFVFLQMPATLATLLGRETACPKQQKHTLFVNLRLHPGAENVIHTYTSRDVTVLR